LGDHHPKGLDIEKDTIKRLTEFLGGRNIGWERLALQDFANEALLGFETKKKHNDRS
jgi:hypothetical protein